MPKNGISELDDAFLKGAISEEEYLHLATEDISILATAVDQIDQFTTVSLIKEGRNYNIDVIYSQEFSYLDENINENNTRQACNIFFNKIKMLEKRGHKFSLNWYLKKFEI